MWCLPNINSMNLHAHLEATKLEKAAATGKLDRKVIRCDRCEKKATNIQLYYDIFSDDPKGLIGQCADHEGYGTEGYFYCGDCDRLMVENYTWELYFAHTEDGDTVCLPCYAKRTINDPHQWIQLDEEAIGALDFEIVRTNARHLIGVEMPVPKGIKKYGEGVLLDGSSGGRIRGFSSSESTPDGGVEDLKSELRRAASEGYTEALLILDGAYQFCVSIGVYVRG